MVAQIRPDPAETTSVDAPSSRLERADHQKADGQRVILATSIMNSGQGTQTATTTARRIVRVRNGRLRVGHCGSIRLPL
jgi:hypothetical protein